VVAATVRSDIVASRGSLTEWELPLESNAFAAGGKIPILPVHSNLSRCSVNIVDPDVNYAYGGGL